MAEHTPGPWRVDEAGDIVSGPYNVCIPYATKPEDKALIAAAPDLLAACQAAEDYCAAEPGDPAYSIYRQLHAAIARARGARP